MLIRFIGPDPVELGGAEVRHGDEIDVCDAEAWRLLQAAEMWESVSGDVPAEPPVVPADPKG